MIGSLLIKLRPFSSFKVMGRGEEALYHLLLNVLEKKSKTLAQEILRPQEEKPVTLSPILRGAKHSRGFSILSPQKSISFRITYLHQEILEPLIQGFFALASREEPLKLSPGEIVVERVDMQKSTQANFTTFHDLLAQTGDQARIVLEFCSPTSFQAKPQHLDVPLPKLVFSSLLKKWNAFSEVRIAAEVIKEYKKIEIERLRLTTEYVPYQKFEAPGFMGKVVYALPKSVKKDTRTAVNALADFAFFSGVGRNTILGMGQTRRKEE
jgi:CRISPR-associated endoribonuclease Cas6